MISKPLTDEAHILFIEFIAAKDARAKLLEGAGKAWRDGRSEAALWDTAQERYSEKADEIERRLRDLGYEWGGEPSDEWPELITEREQ